ncbi:antibiotic biosynthesis monooxygenase [Niallia circulans]|uniref:Antibiotic biosynthesis monooxygenase n=1 Tax=Niallia circulans TaxID=1397 RepID=A0A553SN26_NIACI|nr:antibiotic biosynthesis monooxygenase [Niallia circulans]TRZ38368.1 antibiotic biosynthesis monooxygenase [Niallia circulans]
MFVITRTMIVKEGTSDLVVNKFSQGGIVEEQEGFVDVSVYVKKVRRGDEEVLLIFRWESEEAWKNWEKSPAHIEGHRKNIGKPKPDHIISVKVDKYELKAVKKGKQHTETN